MQMLVKFATTTTTLSYVLFGRCGGTGSHRQRSTVGGADHVHGAGAHVGRVPVLSSTAIRTQSPGQVPPRRRRRRHRRRGHRRRRVQPAPPTPPAPSSAPASRPANAVAPIAQPHPVVVRTARVRRFGRTVRQRGQRVTSTAPRPPRPRAPWTPAPLESSVIEYNRTPATHVPNVATAPPACY